MTTQKPEEDRTTSSYSVRSAASRSRQIVELQLKRVAQRAATQDGELEFSDPLVEHFAEVGYDPEFGAHVLKRRIRTEVETWLADAMSATTSRRTIAFGSPTILKSAQ
jgi:ATP-dependent Clp protease ATP-binding subunit ClpA